MDFFVALFSDCDSVRTSDQLAASWGYYNTVKGEWNVDVMKSSGFPVDMLPTVLASEEDAGTLSHQWFGIPAGTPIGVALGDLQCSVRSTLVNPDTDAVLNVSTSAQMAFVKKAHFVPTEKVPAADIRIYVLFSDF